MKKLVVLLLVSLMATTSFAVIDPDPDMLGVYFDLDANFNCTTAAPSVPFTAYFVITNPSAPEISGVEFGYTLVASAGPGTFFRLSEILPAGGLNVGNSSLPDSGDYVVGLASPLPGQPAVVMATWSVLLLAPQTLDFYLGPAVIESIPDGLPAMEIGGSIVPLGYSTGGSDIPAASVNGDCPVSVEETSFGSVKSLFR